MMQGEERRARGSGRVSIETLVEIAGNQPGIPAFEAEALDVSARGMHLRTAYLPDEGAPLVCRFEDRGREIVVEGVVAWRKESSKGGDFGVTFTALDSRSVDALRELVKSNDAAGKSDDAEAVQGSRVRLHIEGLGSPMKARVRSGSGEKIQVGSSLEFLKVGRRLEIEDLEVGRRRVAHIDGVEVVVNPKTSVPQLVVALRYEGAAEDTPQPTVTDLDADSKRAASLRLAPDAVTMDEKAGEPAPSGDVPEATDTDDEPRRARSLADDDSCLERDEDDDDAAEADAAVPATTRAARRLGNAAENAGVAARDAGVAALRLGSGALSGVTKLLGGASAKIAELGRRRAPAAKRRTTSPAPEHALSAEAKRLRPQSGKSAEAESSRPSAKRRKVTRKQAALGAAGVVLVGSLAAWAFQPSEPTAKKASVEEKSTAERTTAAARPAALVSGSTPFGAAPVSANVPLFGATPLATIEPAPLGPPPSLEAQATEAAERAEANASAPESAEDEEFPESMERAAFSSKKVADSKSSKRPEDVAPWGRGRMHLPTIQRLRLDAPGAALNGVVDPMGFTVLVPGRKLMEQGAAIAKRDGRIARIRTTNTPDGAQVRIAFRDAVPGYRVRLRRDYIELLISAPEENAKKPANKALALPARTARDAKPPAASRAVPR